MKYIYYTIAQKLIVVLNMSFDKFLLAVESSALSQADKGIIKGSLAKLMFLSVLSFKNLQV